MAIKFSTPADFPKPDDVKEEGDTHRYLADLECTSIDDDGKMEWKLLSLDGVAMPEEEEESEEEDMGEYDESDDEPSEDAPKDAKGVAALILKPPAQ